MVMLTNNHLPNFRCLPTFLLFIVMKLQAKKKMFALSCYLTLKKKLLIKVAYWSKFCYLILSCDPKSKGASFGPTHIRDRAV
jgi:hypothetical protein